MSTPRSVASPNVPVADKDFASDVQYYLTLEPRQLPSRYLYDALGSALFNAICELPWYRITRAELKLLETHGRAIFAGGGARALTRIVELGPGNGSKLRTLLGAAGYGPAEAGHHGEHSHGAAQSGDYEIHLVDVSATALDEASRALAMFEDARVIGHVATYEAGLDEIARQGTPGRTLVLFLGSNIGNFDRPCAEAFLRGTRSALARGDQLLIGADLVKPEADLLLAYDDPLGVTAAFNRNLLVRINRDLGGDFDLDGFAHRAVWNAAESRVEMHLVSLRPQQVRIPAAEIDVSLEEGETIWTESSYKYELSELIHLLESASFRPVAHWTAPGEGDNRFVLMLVRAD
ncbi:MAG TPA: L-histidine N(alpha)-methyltransferase [Vicinamibacterales bacterium]|nr:L-histidine N(alpha)-methyltransferase [Vicinamibacterales bacterium]